MKKSSEIVFKSEKQDWRTPGNLIDLISKVEGIGLDPCAGPEPINNFAMHNFRGPFIGHKDGLKESWHNYGLVYINPPFNQLKQWSCKLFDEANSNLKRPDHFIFLCPARTDTKYFHDYLFPIYSSICFLKGRLKFEGGGTNLSAPFPTALIYVGEHYLKFNSIFKDKGHIVMPQRGK